MKKKTRLKRVFSLLFWLSTKIEQKCFVEFAVSERVDQRVDYGVATGHKH